MQRACVIIYRSLEHAFRLLRLPVRTRGFATPWQCGVVLLSHSDHAARRGERRSHRGTCFYLFRSSTPGIRSRRHVNSEIAPLPWLRLSFKNRHHHVDDLACQRQTSTVVKQTALTIPLRWLSLPSADISICARSPRASTWRRRKHYAMSLLIPPAHLRTPSPPVP
jgi:hypothetical protein